MKPLDIAFCTDKNYAPYTGVAMNSIILNNIGVPIRFHILGNEMLARDYERMQGLGALYCNCEVHFYNIANDARVNSYKLGYHFTKEMFYRWHIPQLLNGLEKVLYLDGDVLCMGNIVELFKVPLLDIPFMAPANISDDDRIRLKLSNNHTFYTGQLMINVKAWNNNSITEKAFKMMDEKGDSFLWPDNDALNCVVDGDFIDMPAKYCRMVDCNIEAEDCAKGQYSMIHYLGSNKPWLKLCFNKNKNIWWSYAKRSLWHDLEPVEKGTINEMVYLAEMYKSMGRYQESAFYYDKVMNVLKNNK